MISMSSNESTPSVLAMRSAGRIRDIHHSETVEVLLSCVQQEQHNTNTDTTAGGINKLPELADLPA